MRKLLMLAVFATALSAALAVSASARCGDKDGPVAARHTEDDTGRH